jgi:hypothetical protein
MFARGAWSPGVLAVWLAGGGCAAGGDDPSGGGPLRCGPGTVEQDGFCVGADDGAGGTDDRDEQAPNAPAGGEGEADPPAGEGERPAEADSCGACNTDGECAERCPGTHCARVDGDRRCVAEEEPVADLPQDPDPGGQDPACGDPCGLWAQCGCPVGQGCAVDGAGSLECVETGTARQGESCADTPCDAGYFCLADDSCAAYCDDDHPCPEGSACIVELQDWEGWPLATLCWGQSGCDLLAQDCGAGQSCALVEGDPGTDCVSPGAATVGDACTYADDCVAASSCVQFQDEDTAHCREHCDVTARAPCPAGLECFGLDVGDAGICAPAA